MSHHDVNPSSGEEEEGDENWSDIWQGETTNVSPTSPHKPVTTSGARNSTNDGKNGEQKDGSVAATGANSSSSIMSRMALNDNKAGMQGLDREKINKIIYETSKGSRFYENELKKEEQVNKRIREQQTRLDKLLDVHIKQGEKEAEKLLQELEATRELSRTIVHVDMDAFYAAVEMRNDPSLREKPMAVGGVGMLSTSNYLARRYGVRAGMPGFIGKKLCPDLVIVPSNFAAYRAASGEIRQIFSDYDPNFSPMSLDEAYLDLTEHARQREGLSEEKRTFAKRVDPEKMCQCRTAAAKPPQPNTPTIEWSDPDGSKHRNDSFSLKKVTNNISDLETRASASDESANVPSNEKEVFQQSHTEGKYASDTPAHHDSSMPCATCGKPITVEQVQELETFGTTIEEAVREMRFRIHQKTQLTASAGIAPNMMLAKVCSDKNKPNGQYRILPTKEAVLEFVKDLPIRKVSGIGKVSEKMLKALDIILCPQLYENRGILYHLYSNISFNYFMRISLGIGSTKWDREGERKSMSTERTFRELSVPADLYKKCYELSQSLSEDLKEEDLVGKTVTLKIKLVTFETRTRAQTLINYTQDMEQIYSAARDLLKTEINSCSPHPLKLRLMGVRMSNMLPTSQLGDNKQGTISSIFKKLQKKPPDAEKRKLTPAADVDMCNILEKTDPDRDPNPVAVPDSNTCPVCSIEIPTDVDICSHVDKCLEDRTGKEDNNSLVPVYKEKASLSRKINFFSQGASFRRTEDSALKTGTLCREDEDFVVDNTKAFDSVQMTHVSDKSNAESFTQSSVGTQPNKEGSAHSSKIEAKFTCPICNQEQQSDSLESFNRHVDDCLNRQAIKEIVQEQNRELSNVQKRSHSTESSQANKKRKKTNTSNVRTLDSFFK